MFNISFYSTKDTKTPMINSIMGITAIMCVAIILLNRYLGNLIVGFKLELLYTMLIVLIGSLINMILLYLLKVKEFNYVYYMTANKIKQTIGTVLFD